MRNRMPANTSLYASNPDFWVGIKMVPTTGFEPVRCYSLEPESSASANSATWASSREDTIKFAPKASGQFEGLRDLLIKARGDLSGPRGGKLSQHHGQKKEEKADSDLDTGHAGGFYGKH
jgi:hypothetical protein